MAKHKPVPELIEKHHRWQCKICHSWINYSEANGVWWHEGTEQDPTRPV